MSTPADLLGLARTRIDACPSRTPDRAEVKEAAAALLADLFTVSLRHGITPADWAAVAALPTACLDACRLRQERAARLAASSPRPMTLARSPTETHGPSTSRARPAESNNGGGVDDHDRASHAQPVLGSSDPAVTAIDPQELLTPDQVCALLKMKRSSSAQALRVGSAPTV